MHIISHTSKPSVRYWMLAIYLLGLFATGGSSRTDVQSLAILYPFSAIACGLACITLRRHHFHEHRVLLGWVVAFFILPLLHLFPMPPVVWRALAAPQDHIDAENLVGLSDIWRPLTLASINGWHALISLLAPLAIILFGIQLGRDDLFRLLPLLIALAALSGLIGVLQAVSGPQSALYFYSITHKNWAVGLFASRNHAATLLACLFPMLAVYASTMRDQANALRMRQLTLAIFVLVLVPLLLVTGSRAGLTCGAVGLVVAAVFLNRPNSSQHITRSNKTLPPILWSVLPIAGVISMVVLTYSFAPATAIERFFEDTAYKDDRTEFWSISIELCWEYFPWGAGSGSFVEAYQIMEPTRLLDATFLNHAHNDWVETAATFGAPGIIILLAALIAYFIRSYDLWRNVDDSKRTTALGRLASVMIAIIAIASVPDYPLRTQTMMSLLAICVLWLNEAGRAKPTVASDAVIEN